MEVIFSTSKLSLLIFQVAINNALRTLKSQRFLYSCVFLINVCQCCLLVAV